MKTNTIIKIEYTPCGLTAQGRWRPISALARFSSQKAAERALEEHKKDCAKHPRYFQGCKEYKIMKRTVITTISEWGDVEQEEDNEKQID